MPKIEENFSLKELTTFKIGGRAKFFTRLNNAEDTPDLVKFAEDKNLPVFILGGGSNIVVSDVDLQKFVIKNEILGKKIIEENENHIKISVGAGEDWDEFVEFSVTKNFSGLEALSAIPGTVGGAPIQNIGAYGAEVSNVIDEVEVFDMKELCFKTLSNAECEFSYRDSVFKKSPGRYLVLSAIFRLSKNEEVKIPDYPGVKESLGTDKPNLASIREVIKSIRANKLPDPRVVPNVGSFFKNPIVSPEIFQKIKNDFPGVKSFPAEGGVKIPAGWLIEIAVGKGANFGPVGTYKNNALVLVNNSGATFEDVKNAQDKIMLAVKEKFGIELEQEPIIVA
jgi:UDP-N-acetylmuramate dehydrogenase